MRTSKFFAVMVLVFAAMATAANADVKALLDSGATLKGDKLEIAKKVTMNVDGSEVKEGDVILADGRKFHFDFRGQNDYLDPLVIMGGTLKLRPAAVGKYSVAANPLPVVKTKDGPTSPEVKSKKGQEAPKAEKKAEPSMADFLASLEAKHASKKAEKAETSAPAKPSSKSVDTRGSVIPEEQWTKNKKAEYRAKNLEGKGTKKSPFTFRDLMRISRWMSREQGWKFEPQGAGLTNGNYTFALTGRQIQHIDFVRDGDSKVHTPSYEPDDVYVVDLFIASFYPYDAGADADAAIEIDVSNLYTKPDETVSLFGRKMEAGSGGFSVVADRPVRIVGTVPANGKIDFPKHTYLAGEKIDEVVFANGQFTRWLTGAALKDVNGQAAQEVTKIDASKISSFRSVGDLWRIDGSKNRGAVFMAHRPVTFVVPSWMAKVDTESGSVFPGKTVTLQTGQQCSIWGKKAFKL